MTTAYARPARALHWIVALLVLGMIPVGLVMVQEGLPRPVQNTLFILHKNTGVLVLLLMVVRVAYRASNPPPPRQPLPAWQERAAAANHALLYLLLLLMPISGYVRVRAGDFPIEALDALGLPTLVPVSEPLAEFAKATHYYAGWALMALVGIHIAAALHHAFVRRDGILSRIWPPA